MKRMTKKWLMSTKYNKDDKSGQILVFWDEATGDLIEVPYKEDHYPYFYTKLTEQQIMNIEAARTNRYVIKDEGKLKWDRRKVVKCEQVKMIHPRTRETMLLTKVYVTKPSYVTNKNDGNGLSQLIAAN